MVIMDGDRTGIYMTQKAKMNKRDAYQVSREVMNKSVLAFGRSSEGPYLGSPDFGNERRPAFLL
jgi:hypothetical protein